MRLFGMICVFASVMAAGCASMDPDRESDLPWNVPQSWEGSPSIPGLSN